MGPASATSSRPSGPVSHRTRVPSSAVPRAIFDSVSQEPLSDSFGRKPILYVGLAIYIAAALASTVASSQAKAGEGIAFAPMRPADATWYGPGLYGNLTACGQVLRPGTVGVAHRTLPCGTPVKFVYRGRQIVTRVIDRGPYSEGHAWDLTNGARRALGFEGSDRILFAVGLNYARQGRR